MTRHILKTLPHYFWPVCWGHKTFEIRRNDRDFQVGDILILREWNGTEFTPNPSISYTVTYITSFNQEPGWVVMGIDRLEE